MTRERSQHHSLRPCFGNPRLAHLARVSTVSLTALIFLLSPVTASGETSSPPDSSAAYVRAIAPGSTRADVDAWLATLPTVDSLYVIEGDLLYTEQQARGYISAQKSLNDPSVKLSTQELILNQRPDGLPDYYKDPKDRVLTYAIDRSSFGDQRYQIVLNNFEQGASQWMALCDKCGIQFVHEAEEDAHPNGKTNFVVRYDTRLPKGTIALSFFPSDPLKRREVHVAPAYFTNQTYDPIGVFRHELGHVLGYRHEHIRNSGCAQDAGGDAWIAITPYDSHSVMHYPCGGGGSTDFPFSRCDISGHLLVYGPSGPPGSQQSLEGCEPTAPTAASGATGAIGPLIGSTALTAAAPTAAALGVNFEGGFVAKNIFEVLRVLNKSHVLPVKSYEIQAGDNPDTVYRRLLGAPQGFSDALSKLFTDLNPGITASQLKPGTSINVPDAKLSQYEFAITYNPDSAMQKEQQKQQASSWSHILRSTELADAARVNRFTGYRLVVYGDAKALTAATQSLTAAFPGSQNVLITGPGRGSSKNYSVTGFPKSIVQQLDGNKSVPAGIEGELWSIFMSNAASVPCTSRAVDVFLLDGEVEGHPDIADALAFNVGTAQLPELGGQKQTQERIFADPDHATHMAGLIVAQANGFGIIGLAPCSTLHPYNWQTAYDSVDNRATLTYRMINQRLYNDTISSQLTPIVVMATDWPDDATKASMSNYIRHEKTVLWVVAAGDPRLENTKADATWPGVPIDSESSPGPMNLGAEENVVVVTACIGCDVEARSLDNSHPALASWANFSAPGSKTVRMAAPGEPILSTVKGGQYATAFGTSQATAEVGGIAAAMVSRFPACYKRAAQIKYWLELTALPFGSNDDQKVAAGIVNPDAALRDPRKNYFATKTTKLREAQKVEWCRGDIKLKNQALTDTLHSASNDQILRLVYSSSSGMWTYFTRSLRDDITPIVIKGPSGYVDGGPIVKIDGVVYTSQNLRELILPATIPDTTPCIQGTPAGTE